MLTLESCESILSAVWSCLWIESSFQWANSICVKTWGSERLHTLTPVHHKSGVIAKRLVLVTLPVCDMLVLPLLSCEGVASFSYTESGGASKLVWYTTARFFHPATVQTQRDTEKQWDQDYFPTITVMTSCCLHPKHQQIRIIKYTKNQHPHFIFHTESGG